MAFAATLGDVPRVGWLLFLATVIWVVVYDTQYAMTDRPDDIKIGVRSTAILFGDLDRAFVAGLQALFLASLVLVGRSADMGAWYYGGLSRPPAFCLYQTYLIKERDVVQSLPRVLEQRVARRRECSPASCSTTRSAPRVPRLRGSAALPRCSPARPLRRSRDGEHDAARRAGRFELGRERVDRRARRDDVVDDRELARPTSSRSTRNAPATLLVPRRGALPGLRRRRDVPLDAAQQRRHLQRAASTRAISCAWL